MNTKLTVKLTALALFSTLNLQPSTCFAQGSLTPPGAPAPTMKSLLQVEPRTAITNTGAVTISQSGSYYLTTNITVNSGNAITIGAGGVTLDLNGFTVSSSANPNSGSGVDVLVGVSDISIVNGHIQGGVTFSGGANGTYSGPGFIWGIYASSGGIENLRIRGVTVSGCQFGGIYVSGDNSSVESCSVNTIGGTGIYAEKVSRCAAFQCGGVGIEATGVASGCHSSGCGIMAAVANNCYGQSVGGEGVHATTANNCNGFSSGANGLYATAANNCYGGSTSGNGVQAASANNCVGESDTGTGLYATDSANACTGKSSSGTGLYAANIAIGCYGSSVTSTGLVAWIGNTCWGGGSPALSIGNKFNSP
jgi:hypothetical protein